MSRMAMIPESPLEQPYSSDRHSVSMSLSLDMDAQHSDILAASQSSAPVRTGRLFGGPTPSREGEKLSDEDDDNVEGLDRSVLGDLSQTSEFIRRHHNAQTHATGAGRRVSFGPPSASRLSFGSSGVSVSETEREGEREVEDSFDQHLFAATTTSTSEVYSEANSAVFSASRYSLRSSANQSSHSMMMPSTVKKAHPGDVSVISDTGLLSPHPNSLTVLSPALSVGGHSTHGQTPSILSQLGESDDSERERDSDIEREIVLSDVVTVLSVYANAIQCLSSYQCLECITLLQHSLPLSHYRSAYTCQLIGKAYTEMNSYHEASLAFREMIRLEPFRIHGLDTFSAVLWQLKVRIYVYFYV